MNEGSLMTKSQMKTIIDDVNFINLMEEVKKNCKETIKVCREVNSFIYRGMRVDDYGVKDVRPDRKPKDTSLIVHNMVDDHLEDIFGWKPRSNGLFTSGAMSQTASYGAPYIVFLKDKFEFIWSPEVYDSYTWFSDDKTIGKILHDNIKIVDLYNKLHGPESDDPNVVWMYDKGYEYVHTDIKASNKEEAFDKIKVYLKKNNIKKVLTINDIEWNNSKTPLWRFKQNYIDEFKTGKLPEYNDILRDLIDDYLDKQLKYIDKDLPKAIRTGHEIIFNTPSYYYFDYYKYSNVIRKILGMEEE